MLFLYYFILPLIYACETLAKNNESFVIFLILIFFIYLANYFLVIFVKYKYLKFSFLQLVLSKYQENIEILFKVKKIQFFLSSLKFFFLYSFFVYKFFIFFFQIKISYYFKTIFSSLYFILIKTPFLIGSFITLIIFNIIIIWPFLFLKYLLISWCRYFLILTFFFLIYLYIISYKEQHDTILNFYFYNKEDLQFLNFNLYNFLNPSFFNEGLTNFYNSNIENFLKRKNFYFSNLNSIGTLDFIHNYYITKNNFISESFLNTNYIISNLDPLYYLETKSPTSLLAINPDFKKLRTYYLYISRDLDLIDNLDATYIKYSFLNKIKYLNLTQHKQIYSIYLNAAFFQLNTTNADWYQMKSMYTNNWLSTNEATFYLTNSFFLELLNFLKFLMFYVFNSVFPSDIFFLWLKYSFLDKICIIINFLYHYNDSDNFILYSEKFLKFCIFSLPDKFLFDLGYIYKIQIYTLIEIMFDHLFGFCLKIYKVYNINIGNHSASKKLLLLFTDASLQFKYTMQTEDYDNNDLEELTLKQYPFLAQYNESELITFSTYSLYTKLRRYCYVIEGSPFFQEQTNIHNYTSKSTPAGLDEELEHLEVQDKLIVKEFENKEEYPTLNYWSFWADLNITFDSFDKDIFIKENILKGNVFPGNLYDCFEFNNIPFFGGDKIILFKTFPTQMSSSFENFFSYGNISTKLRFNKIFTGESYTTGNSENSRTHHVATITLRDSALFAKYLKNLINLENYEKTNLPFYKNNSKKIHNNIDFNSDIIFNFQKRLTSKDFKFLYEDYSKSFISTEKKILDFYKKSNKGNRIFDRKTIKTENLISELFRLVQVQVVSLFFNAHQRNAIAYSSDQTISQNLFDFLNNTIQNNIDNLINKSDTFTYNKLNLEDFPNLNKETDEELIDQINADEYDADTEFNNQVLHYEMYNTLENYVDSADVEEDVNIDSLNFFFYKNQNSVENLYSKFFSTFGDTVDDVSDFFLLINNKGDSMFFFEDNRLVEGFSYFSQDFNHTAHLLGNYYNESGVATSPTVSTHSLFYFWLKSLDSNVFISKEIGKYQIHNELSFPSFRIKTVLSNIYTLQIYFFFYFLLHIISIVFTFYLEIINFIFVIVLNLKGIYLIYSILFYFLIRLVLLVYYIVYLNLSKIEYNYQNFNNYKSQRFFFKIIKLKIFFEHWVLISKKDQNKLIYLFNKIFTKNFIYFLFFICFLLIIEFLFFVLNLFIFFFNFFFKKFINFLLTFFFKSFIFFGFFNKFFLVSLLYMNLFVYLIKRKAIYFIFLLFKFFFYYFYQLVKFTFFKIIIPLYFFSFFWLFSTIFLKLYNIEISDLYPTYLMLINIFFLLYILSSFLIQFSNLIFESKFNIIDLNFYAQEDFYETNTYNDTNPDETLASNPDNFENTENIYWETLYYHPRPEKMARDVFVTDEGFLISDMIRKSNNFYDLLLLRKLNVFFFEKIKNSYSYQFKFNKNLTNFSKNALLNFYELHYRFFSVTVYIFTYILLFLNKIKGFEHRLFQYQSFIYMFWYKFQDENLDRTKDIDLDDFSFSFIFSNFKRNPLYFKQRILYSDFTFSEEESFLKNSFLDDVFLIKFFDLDTSEQNPIILNKNNKVFDLSLYSKNRLSYLFDEMLDTNSIKLRKFLFNGYLSSNRYTNIIILNNPLSSIKDNSFLHVEEDDLFILFDFELGLNVDYLDYYLQFYLGFQTKFNFNSNFSSFYIKIINPFELYDNKFKYKFFSNIRFYVDYLNLTNFPNLSKKEFEKVMVELNCTEAEWDSLEFKKKTDLSFPFNAIEFTIFFLFFFNFFITKNNEENFWSLLINPLDLRSEDESVVLENSLLSNLNLSEPSLLSTQFFEFLIFYIPNFIDKLILIFTMPDYTHKNLWFLFKELFLVFYFFCNIFDLFFFYFDIKFNINSIYYIYFIDFIVYFQFFFIRILHGFFFYDFFFFSINFFNIYIFKYIYIIYLIFFFLFNLFILLLLICLLYIIFCFSYFYLLAQTFELTNKNKKNILEKLEKLEKSK